MCRPWSRSSATSRKARLEAPAWLLQRVGKAIIALIEQGCSRPGVMQRSVSGLSAKVLNERLRKLLRYGIIERQVYAEVPPHV